MLVSLEIKNFLIINNLSVNFIKGFNTFTGETGSGKSIILDALKLVLGNKNYNHDHFNNNKITLIKAVFEINQKIKNNLDSLGIEIEDDYLIVERQISENQKSKILLNNQITSLNAIRKINLSSESVLNNKWSYLPFIGNMFSKLKIGIIGYNTRICSLNDYRYHYY